MIGVLVKKQLMEVFKGYFYNQKKNKARSKAGTIGMLVGYAFLMIGLLGGIFAGLSVLIGPTLFGLELDWLYFLMMGMIALMLGVFGSVFNTFASLYKARDNDLLLSMPIPVRAILISRLMNVYLLGLMYSAIVIVPAVIVYWIMGTFSVTTLIGGVGLILILSFFILVLSCVLGYVVAQISSRLKNKSFTTVIISIVFLGLYYVVCFKMQEFINSFLANAALVGEAIRGKAFIVYSLGLVGQGNLLSMLVWLLVSSALVLLAGWIISRSFLKLATVSDVTVKREYKETTAKERTMFGTLLAKEFGRFTSSPTYMLNCGLGVVFMPVLAVAILIKGNMVADLLGSVFGPETVVFLICLGLGAVASMNDMAAPSVSLEGKNLWILQSLPVDPVKVLLAKLSVQLLLTEIPMLTVILASLIVLDLTPVQMLLLVLYPLLFGLLMALLDLIVGLKLPNLNWTNETGPVKQSLSVFIALFGGWIIVAAMGGLYIWKGHLLGFTGFAGICIVLELVVCAGLLIWLVKRGGKVFMELG